MAKTCVIGDLHGRFDLFTKAVEALPWDCETVVFLGDYVDRGPQSAQLVAALRKGSPSVEQRWVILRGNHEDMMAESILDELVGTDSMWMVHGGVQTLASFKETGDSLKDAARWMQGLPETHADQHRVYVHAALHPALPLEWQPRTLTGWTRYPDSFVGWWNGKHIVHGHTPKTDGPILMPGRTNMDVGCCHTGLLCIAVFDDDLPGGPVSLQWVS